METISVGSGETNGDTITTSTTEVDGVPVSVVHVTIPSSGAHSSLQSIIGQPSVIQTASGQTIQAIQVQVGDGDTLTSGPLSSEDEESRKRRELLARRPSYRKILNELSSDPGAIAVTKVEEESNSSQTSQDSESGTDAFVPIQLATGDGSGLQTLTMTNVAASSSTGPTVLQYATGADGQIFIPDEGSNAGNYLQTIYIPASSMSSQVSNISAGNIQYQITPSASSLGQGVVMATTGSTVASTVVSPVGEEATRKRELRLLKNREAARECRRKKKDYIKCLENRVALLENQNKTLIEELKSLKELYCQKEVQ